MSIAFQVVIAIIIDLLVGDPRWPFHPVRLMGSLLVRLEKTTRKNIRNAKLAGVVTAAMAIAIALATAFGLVVAAEAVSPVAGEIVSIIIIYFSLSIKDLASHSMAVYRRLENNDIEGAREKLGLMVGRDTQTMDETEIVRAASESVAESCVDGIASPLFYATLLGPLGAIAYKIVNTMDSMFGYKSERYLHFGWAAARLDDIANYIPARITAVIISLAAIPAGMNAADSLRTVLRDGHRHPSPNSGLPEAAFAGAMGVRFGGVNIYNGKKKRVPEIGEQKTVFDKQHIKDAVRLMLVSILLTASVFIGVRIFIDRLY
ncbi:Adenosylcobinamide-phosphate synthase [hydrothermal vent metagenome]|uniref:Adenosylcobinamide-phosphate synthase n=1 Tax=hydrothermal vent metagenome TaxID=652676 RepID=A0A3B1CCE7_9ZZZZ